MQMNNKFMRRFKGHWQWHTENVAGVAQSDLEEESELKRPNNANRAIDGE